MSFPSTIAALNQLPDKDKRETYAKIIPPKLLEMFSIPENLRDSEGNDLFYLHCPPESADAEMALYQEKDGNDPLFFGHITDTIHGQLHILLYGMNDLNSPRFDVDRLPDGTKTNFGFNQRNLDAEEKALKAGLAPGQIYSGPHLFKESLHQFEVFVSCMGQDLYFVEPLYYHVALILERYEFHVQSGKKLLKKIEDGFSEGGDLLPLLDGSTPFRDPNAANRIRLRSWALHDNILGEPFTNVTMFKYTENKPDPCRDFSLPW